MADIKLSKAELAALDLLIADLQEAKIKGPFPATTIVTRVMATAVRAFMLTARTGQYEIGQLPTLGLRGRRGGKLRIGGKDVPRSLTLAALIELRRRAGGETD